MMQHILLRILIVLLIWIEKYETLSSSESNLEHSKQKRFIPTPYLPYQTGIALGVGVAVPVDNGRGDIFISFCIQSNYNEPTFPALSPPPFQKIYGDTENRKFNDVDFNENGKTTTNAPTNQNEKQLNISETLKKILETTTRKKFFKLLERKLEIYGLNGKSCLLKAICETSSNLYGQYNGVIGDIIHILFTPSSSKCENLPSTYYRAERHGNAGNGMCDKIYGKICPIGIFDFLSHYFK